jgi:hypothetical protein
VSPLTYHSIIFRRCGNRKFLRCTFEMFEKLNVKQIAAFILARVQESDKPRYLSMSSLPKKGTAKLASEKDNCMVLIAYNYRDRENNIRAMHGSQT